MASLAASFESVAAALPMLTNQLRELSSRTKAMEEKMNEPSMTLALTRPLGGSNRRPPGLVEGDATTPTSFKDESCTGSSLSQKWRLLLWRVTALAAQIANFGGDSLGELAGSTSGFSSKGASGRMTQQELAQHKGTFFDAVLANMSRRVNRAASSSASPQRGVPHEVCGEVRRFWKAEGMGYVMRQVAMIMDGRDIPLSSVSGTDSSGHFNGCGAAAVIDRGSGVGTIYKSGSAVTGAFVRPIGTHGCAAGEKAVHGGSHIMLFNFPVCNI